MIILNFSHPLTTDQISQAEYLTNQPVEDIYDLPVKFNNQADFLPQLKDLMNNLPVDTRKIQTSPLLVNLPSLNYIAALVLAELHGRIGFFPSIIRLRPVLNSLPQRYEICEILNLQTVRETARENRF